MSVPKEPSLSARKIVNPLSETVSNKSTNTVMDVTHAGTGSAIQSSAAKINSAITRCCVIGRSEGSP